MKFFAAQWHDQLPLLLNLVLTRLLLLVSKMLIHLVQKNGFTYVNGSQIPNSSQNNNQPPSPRFSVVHLSSVLDFACLATLEKGRGGGGRRKTTRYSGVKICLSLRQDVSSTFTTGCSTHTVIFYSCFNEKLAFVADFDLLQAEIEFRCRHTA